MKLFEAMGGVDDDLISGAIDYKPRRAELWKLGAIAAAILCVLAIGVVASHYINSPKPPIDTSDPANINPSENAPILIEDNGDTIYINRVTLDQVFSATRNDGDNIYSRPTTREETLEIFGIEAPASLGSFTKAPEGMYIEDLWFFGSGSDGYENGYEIHFNYVDPVKDGEAVSVTAIKRDGLKEWLEFRGMASSYRPLYEYKESTVNGVTGVYVGIHDVMIDHPYDGPGQIFSHTECDAVYFINENTLIYFCGHKVPQDTFLTMLRELVSKIPPRTDAEPPKLSYESNQKGAVNYDDVFQRATRGGAVNPTTWGPPMDYEQIRAILMPDISGARDNVDSIYMVETLRALSDEECEQLGVSNFEKTYYKVRIFRNLLTDNLLNSYEIICVRMGTPEIQSIGDPIYGAGETFAVILTEPDEKGIRTAILGDCLRYDIEYEIDDGGRWHNFMLYSRGSDFDSLNLPGAENINETRITSTTENPAVYTQKLPYESLREFLREDWREWGISPRFKRPFPGRATTERPWYITSEYADLEDMVFPVDYTEEDYELQKLLKDTADKYYLIESMNNTPPAAKDTIFSFGSENPPIFFPQRGDEEYTGNFYPINEEYPQTKEEYRKLLEEALYCEEYIENELSRVSKAEITQNGDGSYSIIITEGEYGPFLEIDGRMYWIGGDGKGGYETYWDSAMVVRKTDTELEYFIISASYGVYPYYDAGLMVFEDGGWKFRYRDGYR